MATIGAARPTSEPRSRGPGRRIVPALAIALGLVTAACGNGGSPGPADLEGGLPVDIEVAVEDFRFEPAEVRVEPGGVVEFALTGAEDHTVTARGDDGPGRFDSGVLLPGETFIVVLDDAGRYEYACQLHSQMGGTIVVAEPDQPASGG